MAGSTIEVSMPKQLGVRKSAIDKISGLGTEVLREGQRGLGE